MPAKIDVRFINRLVHGVDTQVREEREEAPAPRLGRTTAEVRALRREAAQSATVCAEKNSKRGWDRPRARRRLRMTARPMTRSSPDFVPRLNDDGYFVPHHAGSSSATGAFCTP